MSIYDKLVGCIPVNKIAGCVVSLHPEDFQQTGVEERIKQLGEEMFMINKTLSSLKNNFIGTKEKDEILKRKYEIEDELRKLKKNKDVISSMAFSNVFYRICKEKLPEKTFKEMHGIASDIIKYAKEYLVKEEE